MKVDILAFGAHPDDVELGCGGTIAKEVAHGKKVGIVDLTRGELGTRGSIAVRHEEATKAKQILGALFRENLHMRDGFFVNDQVHQLQVIELIRKYRPEIVLCNAPEDRHIDHGRGSKLVADACFLSGLCRIETQLDGISQEPWRPLAVYHYIQWNNLTPAVVVDISDYLEKKMLAIKAFASQFYDPESTEPITPIATQQFLESVVYRAQDLGRLTGVAYGEGFIIERLPLVNSLFDLR